MPKLLREEFFLIEIIVNTIFFLTTASQNETPVGAYNEKECRWGRGQVVSYGYIVPCWETSNRYLLDIGHAAVGQ